MGLLFKQAATGATARGSGHSISSQYNSAKLVTSAKMAPVPCENVNPVSLIPAFAPTPF